MGGGEDEGHVVSLDGKVLENVKEFSYLGSTLNDEGTDGNDCNKRVTKGRRRAAEIRSLVNERNLSIKCSKILQEKILVPTLLYKSACMEWRKRE